MCHAGVVYLPCSAAIAWYDVDVFDVGRLHELPGQGVLSTAVADEQDAQLGNCHIFVRFLKGNQLVWYLLSSIPNI